MYRDTKVPTLFEDNKLKEMFNSLSDKEKAEYKRSGEHMYNKNYEALGSEDAKLVDAAAYISEGLKSGLRPSQLDESELAVMRSIYGEKWFTRFNYESESD
jgi:hypothetical protein